MSKSWEDEIRDGLAEPLVEPFAEEIEDEPKPAPKPAPKKAEGGITGFLVFALTCGLVGAAYYKDNTLFGVLKPREQAPPAQVTPADPKNPPMVVVPPKGDPSVGAKLDAIQRDLEALKSGQAGLKQDVDGLKQKVQQQHDRIVLLGTIVNDNAMGARVGDRDPLYLNPDWTLPRQPRYLQMGTPDDKKFIDDRVKPR